MLRTIFHSFGQAFQNIRSNLFHTFLSVLGIVVGVGFYTFIIISIVSVLVGVIFGTYPAIKASRLDPVEAIRHE